MGDRTLEDIFEAGLIFAAVFGLGIFFLMVDFSSPQANTDLIGRFVLGMMSIIAPTSAFDVFVSVGIAIVGGIAVGREDITTGILTAAFLYGIVSFAIGWFTAPV